MIDFFAAVFGFFGGLLAIPINAATEALSTALPVDLAKAIVVVGLYISGLWVFKFSVRKVRNVVIRLAAILSIMLLITVGIIASDDHVTADSFWFGPYVEFIEEYF